MPTAAETEALNLQQKSIASYEDSKTILIFGTSLADEEPILFLRIRKAHLNTGSKVVVASDKPTDAEEFAHLVLRYKPGTELALAQALAGKGDGAVCGIAPGLIEQARALMSEHKPSIVTTQSMYNLGEGPKVLAALSGLGELSVYGLLANDQGAQELGFVCDAGTHEILAQCDSGAIEGLWLLGNDPFEVHHEPRLVRQAIENVGFLVVQAHTESEAYHYASIVLPMCAPAEMEGTYTNIERRVQRMDQVLPTKGEAKPAWRVFSELALRISGERPFFNAGEIMAEIASEYPAFSNVDYDELLGTEGTILLPAKQPVGV